MKTVCFQQGASRRSVGSGLIARSGLLAVVAILIMASGMPAGALAEEDGDFILQCFCPLSWSGPWDGAGVFNDDESLDTVALTDDGAVLLIREIPLVAGDLAGMIEERTESLERGAAISDLEETWTDGSDDEAFSGRVWVNGDGATMYSFQFVQVWETNFLLSIEFIAPEEEFVEAWDSLELVLLIGSPILGEFDADETVALIGR